MEPMKPVGKMFQEIISWSCSHVAEFYLVGLELRETGTRVPPSNT